MKNPQTPAGRRDAVQPVNESLAQAVLAADEARYQALYAQDCGKLEEMLADDYLHTHANGRTDSKSSFITMIGEGRYRFLNAERTLQTVRHISGACVLSGLTRTSILVGAESREMHNAFVSIWSGEAGSLKMVHWQATRIVD